MKQNQKKMDKGITLIALVVTIILLLILAGISIAQLTGSGLFENAKLAKEKYENAEEGEALILGSYENTVNEILGQSNRNTTNATTILELTYADIFESYSEYINPSGRAVITKNNNIINFSLNTANGNNGTLVPSTSWTTIGILKEEYRPIVKILDFGTTGDASYSTRWNIETTGEVKVYHTAGFPEQCGVNFMYFVD